MEMVDAQDLLGGTVASDEAYDILDTYGSHISLP